MPGTTSSKQVVNAKQPVRPGREYKRAEHSRAPTTEPPLPSVVSATAHGGVGIQLTSAQALQLQRMAGNRAVLQTMGKGAQRGAGSSRAIQPKLTVGAADDPYEREADRVAAQVLAPGAAAVSTPTDGDGEVRRQPLASTISPLRREKRAPSLGGSFEAGASVERVLASGRGAGSPLPARLRADLEPRFGANFAGVRVHTGAQSDQLNRQLGAKAFTHGSDIYLAGGQYDPGSGASQRLLAHELTHVVQQDGAATRGNKVQRLFGFGKKKPEDPTQKFYEQTGEVPEKSRPFFRLGITMKGGGYTRGDMSFKEMAGMMTGHSWIELQLGPDFTKTADLRNAPGGDQIYGALEDVTRGALDSQGSTTIGFYPDVEELTTGVVVKQIFGMRVPGMILEPEQEHFAGKGLGMKSYIVSTPQQALGLLKFVKSKRHAPYNMLHYNCTDFAADAIQAAGFPRPADITNKLGMTTPSKLYKFIYENKELGKKGTQIKELGNKKSESGRAYDVKHLSTSDQKELDKRKAKLAKNIKAHAAMPKGKSMERPEPAEEPEPALAKPRGNVLGVYANKGDPKPAKYLLENERDFINDDKDQGDGWTDFNLMSEGFYYYCKTDEFAAFMNPDKPKGEAVEQPKAKYDHIENKAFRLTWPADHELSGWTSEDGTTTVSYKFPEEHSLKIGVYESAKLQGRCRVDIMGTGKNLYVALDKLFDEKGQPSAAIGGVPKPPPPPPPP